MVHTTALMISTMIALDTSIKYYLREIKRETGNVSLFISCDREIFISVLMI